MGKKMNVRCDGIKKQATSIQVEKKKDDIAKELEKLKLEHKTFTETTQNDKKRLQENLVQKDKEIVNLRKKLTNVAKPAASPAAPTPAPPVPKLQRNVSQNAQQVR